MVNDTNVVPIVFGMEKKKHLDFHYHNFRQLIQAKKILES